MRVIFLLAADIDIQEIYEHCENFQEGRGDSFLASLNAAALHIGQNPWIGPLRYEKFRRFLLRKFDYALFYVLESNQAVVHAIMSLRQDPKAILKRLYGRNFDNGSGD